MSERPILFSGPMVKAILAGAKSQTRRVVKLQHNAELVEFMPGSWAIRGEGDNLIAFRHPYTPGDRLWVRETWAKCTGCNAPPGVIYRADNTPNAHDWRPSIYMPRWASRITLEVTNVRVERLQAISPADAIAEGISYEQHYEGLGNPCDEIRAIQAYADYWDSLHEKGDGVLWESNPFVWVIEFWRVEAESPVREFPA